MSEPAAATAALASSSSSSRSQPLSEYRIAKIAGVSYSHVNRVLRKGHHPRFDTAVKIAVAAGMSLDELAAVVYRDNGELRAAVAEIGKRRGRVPTADDQAAMRRKTVKKARAALAEKRRNEGMQAAKSYLAGGSKRASSR